jgi:hypothetical protein
MNPLKKLIDQIVRPQVHRGRVVRVADGKLVVKTAEGAIIVSADPLQSYALGDTLVLSGGAVIGRDRDDSTLPVFYV